ncbi:hypothetical protein ABIC16_002846 [Sphingomonas sp. PvP055]|uniref:hypothetical protein n=1 Tax=Sphingomonas sp. PvP055 TaxID=3156391 RepID=UPI00339518BB
MKHVSPLFAVPMVLGLAVLSACDPGEKAATTVPATTKPDPMEAKIDALPRALQETTMFRAIRDGGYTCQKIVRFEKHAPIDGHAVWIAECDDRGQYVITLQPGGVFWVSGVPQAKKP